MKLFRFKDKKMPITYYQTNKQVEIPNTYRPKDIRAFWVSNVVNIDLPTITDEIVYRQSVIKMLDTALAYNINTIFFQVRTTNDAFYESRLNPYSRFLTGQEGKKPTFDVLSWLIDEAKSRGLSLHAWCNPYRVSMKTVLSKQAYLDACDDINFAKRHPEFVVTDKNGQLILNPAKEAVKQFIVDSMLEIVSNYNVDGIHFDDYFYPYAGLDDEDNDLSDYEVQKDAFESLDDFRRHHITDVIKRTYDALKKHNRKLLFGVSPFGVWQSKANSPLGSNTDPKCSQSYDNQYADSYLWIKEGYMDYIVPQLYWDFGHSLAPYADLVDWWVALLKDSKVDLYIGHGAYRYGQEGEYENPLEVVNQVKYANQYETVKGNVFFTYKTFIDKYKSKPGTTALKKILNNEEDK